MKCKVILFLALLFFPAAGIAAGRVHDFVQVREPVIPVLLDRIDNVVYKVKVIHSGPERSVVEGVSLALDSSLTEKIRRVRLYYAGTEAEARKIYTDPFAPAPYIHRNVPGKTRAADPGYSVLLSEAEPTGRVIMLPADQPLFPGVNYFWISIEPGRGMTLLDKLRMEFLSVRVNGESVFVHREEGKPVERFTGIGVRHAGDDGVAAYRIPGLATTKQGSLLAVYDVRYNGSTDLQERIDVGLSRSTDGGHTWEKMRIPLTFRGYGRLPDAQNGVGDPSILVDEVTGEIWICALWVHGMGNGRAWFNSGEGLCPGQTGQLVMVKSGDDGKTWSEPMNVTRQVKRPEWKLLLQGPGRGITMQDGTLVFPVQWIDSLRMPYAGIMYSKDRGRSWHIHAGARSNTTEAQVVETAPGTLMLNMRDNRKGSRAVSVTSDMGRTWTVHPSSGRALREPVCMASLIRIAGSENYTGKDLLLFANPDTVKGRSRIMIKASTDNGLTWPESYRLLLDEMEGWGYSCLTRMDPETIGILYEGSTAHLVFQAIRLRDILKE